MINSEISQSFDFVELFIKPWYGRPEILSLNFDTRNLDPLSPSFFPLIIELKFTIIRDIVDPSSMQDIFQKLTYWVLKRNFACLHKFKAKNKDLFIGRGDVKDDHSNLIHDTVIYIGRIKCVLLSKGTDKVLLAQSPASIQLSLIK